MGEISVGIGAHEHQAAARKTPIVIGHIIPTTAGTNGFGKQFKCSHHNCAVCGHSAGEVGGMLFLCAACPRALCENHPPKAIWDTPGRLFRHDAWLQAMGFGKTSTAVYIFCTEDCKRTYATLPEPEQPY